MAGPVESRSISSVVSIATKVLRVVDHWIDDNGLLMVVSLQRDAEATTSGGDEPTGNAAAVGAVPLIGRRSRHRDVPIWQANDEVAARAGNTPGPGDSECEA